MTKLFVGGIPYAWTNQQLEELFAKYGPITSVFIPTDKFSGRSKGFAFVELENDELAHQAIEELNTVEVEGRKLGVSVARPREERPARSGGGGNFRRDNFSRGGGSRGNFQRRDRRD